MEMTTELAKKARIRANISTTTKNEFTLDCTVEIDGIELDDNEKVAEAIVNVKAIQSIMLDRLNELAIEKGYSKPLSK